MILKILKLHSPKGSCNFENFQNHLYLLITTCTRGHAICYTNCTIWWPFKYAGDKLWSQSWLFDLFIVWPRWFAININVAISHEINAEVWAKKHTHNRPFPSSLEPLFQSESKCKIILMKMTLICMKMKLHAGLILIWKVLHLDSFWNRGTRELGNGLIVTHDSITQRMILPA